MAREWGVKPHVLLVPLPAQGHIAPMVTVGFRLAKNGITITLASFKIDILGIKAKYAEELLSLDFHLVELDHDPGHLDTVKVTVPVVSRALCRGIQPVVEKLEADRLVGIAIPTCIIADYLLSFTEDVAVRLGMKRYVFFSCGMVFAKLFQEMPVLLDTGKLQLGEDNCVIPFDGLVEIPGAASLKYSELPLPVTKLPLWVKYSSQFQATARSIVVNTFLDLEPKPINSYQTFSSSKQNQGKLVQVHAIGPIVTAATFTDHSYNSPMVSTGTDCLKWLDIQTAASVLYICCGSMVRLSPPQIKQLALALESSQNCSFLWVLHRGNGNFEVLEDVLPADFRTKVNGRGLVRTAWVSQFQILAHPAISGFLSHCGWCSIMESLTSGVPMIGWPHRADQFLNCRYLVNELKVATEVLRGPHGVVEQKEFEKAFTVLFGNQGKAMKGRCQELKMKGAAAIAPGGSSENAFLQLVEDIKS